MKALRRDEPGESPQKGPKARILASYDGLTGTHRRVADFFLTSPAEVSVMSSAEIGERLGVSNSTIVRFSQMLGYEGYSELKRDLLWDLKQGLEPADRFKLAKHRGMKDTLDSVARQDVDNINATLSRIVVADLSALADMICAARRVYLLGVGISSALALLLYYLLQQVRVDAVNSLSDPMPFEERVLRMSPKDLVIGFSFPPYSRSTLELLKLVRDQNVPVVGVTDRETAPIAFLAAKVLVVATDNILFTNSTTAFSVVANALVTEIAFRHRKQLDDENARQKERLRGTFTV
jgi:DNA-binding MurR/RpiR family transcriptional regulator